MSISLELLQTLSVEQLLDIPKEQIVATVQDAFDNDGDKSLVLEFAFTRLVEILNFSEVQEIICQQLLPQLTGKFDEVIGYADDNDVDEMSTVFDEFINQIQTILQLFLQLLNGIQTKLDLMNVYCLSDIQLPLLSNLHFMCKITALNFLYMRDEIKPLLDALQISITHQLASSKLHLNDSLDELKLCRDVLQALVDLGYQQSSKNDIKTMANTWKHVSKLATDFHVIYRSAQQQYLIELEESNVDVLDWIAFSIESICNLITNNVNYMIQLPKESQELATVLKTTTFYLKLLQSLAKEYMHDEFKGQNYFIKLYEMVVVVRSQFESDDLGSYLMSLTEGFSNILSTIFNCDRFSNELLCQFHGDHMQISLDLVKILLQQSITHNEWYLHHEQRQRNILHHLLFVLLPKENVRMYKSTDIYTEFTNLCAALLLTVTVNRPVFVFLEKKLIEATLSDNVYEMPVLLDIWMIFLRHAPSETRFMYCDWLLNVRRNMAPIPRTPSGVLVQQIFKNTFKLLSESERAQLIQKVAQNDVPVLELLCFNQVNGEIPKLQQHGQQIVTQIKTILAKLDPKSEIATSNECLELMNGLALFYLCPSKQLLSISNDSQLTNYLIDALLRSKSRTIDILASTVIRVLLEQQYLGGNNLKALQIDYSDSSDIRKLYALQMASLVQLNGDRISPNISAVLKSFQSIDDLILTRIQKASRNQKSFSSNPNTSEPLDDSYVDYIDQTLKCHHHFGCTTMESCCDQNATFKRCLDQIVHESRKLESIHKANKTMNLRPFSNEIYFIENLFNRLHNEIS